MSITLFLPVSSSPPVLGDRCPYYSTNELFIRATIWRRAVPQLWKWCKYNFVINKGILFAFMWTQKFHRSIINWQWGSSKFDDGGKVQDLLGIEIKRWNWQPTTWFTTNVDKNFTWRLRSRNKILLEFLSNKFRKSYISKRKGPN